LSTDGGASTYGGLGRCWQTRRPSAGFADYSQEDILFSWYNFVNFGVQVVADQKAFIDKICELLADLDANDRDVALLLDLK